VMRKWNEYSTKTPIIVSVSKTNIAQVIKCWLLSLSLFTFPCHIHRWLNQLWRFSCLFILLARRRQHQLLWIRLDNLGLEMKKKVCKHKNWIPDTKRMHEPSFCQ
jgi:hypothetical protein